MGEAKRRGTFEQRKAEAATRPESIKYRKLKEAKKRFKKLKSDRLNFMLGGFVGRPRLSNWLRSIIRGR